MCVWYGGPKLHLLCPFIHVFSLFHFHLLGQHLSICPATQDALFPWLPAKSGGGFSTWRGVEEPSHTAPTGRGHGSSGSVSSQSQRSDFNLGYLMTGIKTHSVLQLGLGLAAHLWKICFHLFQWASHCQSRESIWMRWRLWSSALTRPWSF